MSKDHSTTRVSVIGAGPGGLAAAMLLAAKGYHVDVYEKQPRIGGRSSRLELGEYRFDRGATFLMIPSLLEELFEAAGRSVHDYVDLKRLDPLYALHFGNTVFTPSSDLEQTVAQIEKLFPGNGEGYRRFMHEEQLKFDRVSPLLRRPFTGWTDYLRSDLLRALPRLHALDTVYGRLSKYFTDERLRWSFTFQSKYLGMSPWECPGTFTILSFMEHRYGLYHPLGGVHALFDAMAKVIQEYGGAIHTSCGVREVTVERGRATGLILDNGERVESDHVVVNADFGTAVTKLFAPGVLRKYTPAHMERKKFSLSTVMLYLGIKGTVDLPHHSVHFAEDYRQNVDDITKHMRLSEDPSIYVHNPSLLDPTLAPAGKSSLYVLMPVPNLGADVDWDRERDAVLEKLLARLERIPALADLRTRIEVAHHMTPLEWENELDVYKGATFNLAHNLGQMMALRPHNRFEEVEGVWLAGGGTHPGSGLPTIFESARISVDLIEREDQRHRHRTTVMHSAADTRHSL